MGKIKLTGLLGVALTIVMGIAFIGCDQPNGSVPEATDTILVAGAAVESTVGAQSARTNRQLSRDELRARLESRRAGAEERRQLAPDVLGERRGRSALNAENPGVRLPRERRTDPGGEWPQRRESRRSRSAASAVE